MFTSLVGSYVKNESVWHGIVDRSAVNVELPSSIIDIGNYALAYCDRMETCQIAPAVRKIGHHAFYLDSRLKTLTIGSANLEIGESAFSGCVSLAHVYMPSLNAIKVMSLEGFPWGLQGKGTIFHCKDRDIFADGSYVSSLEPVITSDFTLKVPVTVQGTITSSVFDQLQENLGFNFTDVTKIFLPEGVSILESKAFSKFVNLEYVSLPQSLNSINDNAFLDCERLDGLWIPKNTVLKPNALFINSTMSRLSTVVFADEYASGIKAKSNFPWGVTKNGPVINGSRLPLTTFFGKDRVVFNNGTISSTSYIVPFGTLYIEQYEFAEYSRKIGGNPFTTPTEVIIPPTVTVIGGSAFEGIGTVLSKQPYSTAYEQQQAGGIMGDGMTPYVSRVIIPYGVEQIGEQAFRNALKVRPEDKGKYPFQGTTAQNVFFIPDSVWDIGREAFAQLWDPISANMYANLQTIVDESNFGPDGKPLTFKRFTELYIGYYRPLYMYLSNKIVYLPDCAFLSMMPIHGVDLYNTRIQRIGSAVLGEFAFQPRQQDYLGQRVNALYYDTIRLPPTLHTMEDVNALPRCKNLKIEGQFYEAIKKGLYQWNVVAPGGPYALKRWEINLSPGTNLEDSLGHDIIPYDTLSSACNITFSAMTRSLVMASGWKNNVIGNTGRVTTTSKHRYEVVVSCIDGDMYPDGQDMYTANLDSATFEILPSIYQGDKYIKYATIPDTVTTISRYAFQNCVSLSTVTLSKKLRTIGESAFAGCTSLKALTMPPSLNAIGANAFGNCRMTMTWDSADKSFVRGIQNYPFGLARGSEIICYNGTITI